MTLTKSQNWTILRLAYWHLERGRVTEAETLARGLLSVDQRNGLAWHYYGESRRRQDDDVEAARAFKEAAKLLEDRADVWMRLGETLLRLGRPTQARRALRSARDCVDDDEALTGRIQALLDRCSTR